jgi:NTE family protein
MEEMKGRVKNTGVMKPNMYQKLELGLALSGGGARGLAHIGVLKALDASGFRPDYLAGTSMGGVIAAGFAAGLNPDELEQIALEYVPTRNLLRLADPTLPRNGLFHGERLRAFFDQQLQGCTFADLHIPLTLVAVDLNSGREIHLREGLVADALRATVSIPGLLTPVEHAGQRLVDGGLLNNLPVDVVREMGADVVLGVDISTSGNGDSTWQAIAHSRVVPAAMEELIKTLGESIDLVMSQQVKHKLKECPPDILLCPTIPSSVTTLTGFNHAGDLISLGEKSTCSIIPDLREALQTR